MKRNKVIWICTISIIIVLTIILSAILILNKSNGEQGRWKTKKVYVDKNEFFKTNSMEAIVPKWEEKNITEKFYSVEVQEVLYNARPKKIDESLIGESLGKEELESQDTYTEEIYKINANIYELKGYPIKCAVALKFEDDNDYYTYINAYYRPRTLREFLDDLNLKETLEFGSVWYEDKDNNYELIEFPDVEDDVIWNMLFDDETLKNVHIDGEYHDTIMGISVNIPIFGYENISVSVSNDGYLTTNIFETGKTFYIGEEKVQKFASYVLENYDGYKTLYVDENGKEINENEYLDEPEPEKDSNEIIMVYQNGAVKPYEVNISEENGKNYTEAYNPGI